MTFDKTFKENQNGPPQSAWLGQVTLCVTLFDRTFSVYLS